MNEPTAKVLIVDHNRLEAEAAAKQCRSVGWSTLVADRSDDALTIFLREYPAIALIELILPDGNGLDLIREIRSWDFNHACRLYLHTTIRGELLIVEGDARKVGATGVLPKPISVDVLRQLAPWSSQPPKPASERSAPGVEADREASTPGVLVEPEGITGSYRAASLDPHAIELEALTAEVDEDLSPPPSEVAIEAVEVDEQVTAPLIAGKTRAPTPPEEAAGPTAPQAAPRPSPTRPPSPTVRQPNRPHGLLDALSAALREEWYGRIRLELSEQRWSEMSVGEGVLWTVTTRGLGPDLVDTGSRHDLLGTTDVAGLRAAIAERGERAAESLLRQGGLEQTRIRQLFELTATERVITALEARGGELATSAERPPDDAGFEAKLPLDVLIWRAIDRLVPVVEAVGHYVGLESELLRLRRPVGQFPEICRSDPFCRQALENLDDCEPLLQWVRRNGHNPSGLFMLLTKLQALGLVSLGDAVGADPSIIATPGQPWVRADTLRYESTAPREAVPSPVPSGSEVAPVAGTQPEPWERDDPSDLFDFSDVVEDGAASEDVLAGLVDALPFDSRAQVAPSDGPPAAERRQVSRSEVALVTTDPFEAAGASGMVEHLVSGGYAVYPDPPSADIEAGEEWRPRVLQAIDRWDHRDAENRLGHRLRHTGGDASASAYAAWLRFARAVDSTGAGDPGRALSRLERLMESDVECATPFFLVGLAAITLGNLGQARAHLDRALQLEPDDQTINAANALLKAGYYDHPEADLRARAVWQSVRRFV